MQKNILKILVILSLNLVGNLYAGLPSFEQTYMPQELPQQEIAAKKLTIRAIHFVGNKLVTDEALMARIPYRPGDIFNPTKTGDVIRNLYALHYFNTVSLELEDIDENQIDLYIMLQEKKKVESFVFEGNRALTEEEIEKELKLVEVPAIDEEELATYANKVRALYAQKNYHAITIETALEPTERDTYIAYFRITEGRPALVRRVIFSGNNCVASSDLRKMIFTREAWLFGFMDKAGTYAPEMLDVDKFILENFYQSNGFLAARVTDITVDIDESTQDITVSYDIDEGPVFVVSSVAAPGNELRSEAELLSVIPVAPGQLYSKDGIRRSMDALRAIWGSYGFIYADIEPVIIPNFETQTVAITFNSELGNKMYLNRITISGNQKTRDYVIRRMIGLCEGEQLSLPAMDKAKDDVQALGFFDPQGGVEWNISKVSEDTVDLEMVLNEVKTGKIGGQIGYGGADPQSPSTSIRIGAGISDRNLFGMGIQYNLNVQWSQKDRLLIMNIFQPWLFNRPIGGGLGFYHRSSFYEDFENVSTTPKESLTGADGQLLFFIPGYPDVSTSITAGIERIEFQDNLRAATGSRRNDQNELMQTFIDRRFASGTQGFIGSVLGQDVRNHPIFPNRGYNWTFNSRIGIPAPGSTFGYLKGDFDATWLTPLIGEYDLVFLLHGHAGVVGSLRDKLIPYRELYNVGGPGTVRGYEFGQIGPQVFGSSVGAQKAFWVNAELIFSVTRDQSIRGLVFYDGGAGWDTPLTPLQQDLLRQEDNIGALRNNRFKYRHAVGFGIRLLNPAPIRIDWGFKLDRDKRRREKLYEVHFSMEQQF